MFCTIMSTFTPASDSGDGILFHDFLLVADQRACIGVIFFKRRQHAQLHLVAHGKLDGPGLEHLGPERRKLQHFLEGDLVELSGLVLDPGVGGVDTIHVRIDVAAFRAKGGGKGDGGRVRSAPAQRGDAALGADALETRDYGDLEALFELLVDRVGADFLDPRGRVGRGGFHRHLPALPAARGDIHFLKAQRHEARRHDLAARDDRIVFARVVKRRGLFDPADKLVRLAGHCADHDDHVIAVRHFARDAFGGPRDAVHCGDRGAAELHDQKRHLRLSPSVFRSRA
jgi:hypothetical protein